MAIPHFNISAQSRGKGASAIAKAAYNTGSKLHELDGRLHAYDRKSGIKFRALVFSQKAIEPHENRETFWQAVEQSEKRKDACVSREFQAALPCELTYEQNLQLAQEFTQTIIARYDLKAADLAIHYPTKRKIYADQEHDNPHLHLLIPDRNRNGKKLDMSRNRNEIFDLRNLWEKLVNTHLASAGETVRISLKSNAEQIAAIDAQLENLAKHERELTAQLETIKKEIQNANNQPEQQAKEHSPSSANAHKHQPETRQSGIGIRDNSGSFRQTGRTAGTGDCTSNNTDTGEHTRLGNTDSELKATIRRPPTPDIRRIAAKIAKRIDALRFERQARYSQTPKQRAKKLASRIEGLRYERQQRYTDSLTKNQRNQAYQACHP